MSDLRPTAPCDIVEAFDHLREAADGAFDQLTGPPCSNCELPVETDDPDHKLPCGCLLCRICLDRGRGEIYPHLWPCRGKRTS